MRNLLFMFTSLRRDVPASIVVFLVALPLCLGIALASGAPPLSGLIAGIVGGVVIGLASGSALGVSGPAAGLTVIVLTAVTTLPSFEAFLLAVVLAGVLQILLGVLRAGIIGLYFPSSVIQGMLSAIGIIIILKQIPHLFGYDKEPEGTTDFIQRDGYNTVTELGHMLDFVTPGAALIGLLALVVVIAWEQPFLRRMAALRFVPGSLVAVVLAAAANAFFLPGDWVIGPDHLVALPTDLAGGNLLESLTGPDWTLWAHKGVWTTAITLAVVASIETLLCVEATDKLDPERRVTPTNRELYAQGLGNMVSGFLGGLPVTQVIVRSSANIQSGGHTQLSTVLHGVLLLLAVLLFPVALNSIPLSALAAILLLVGYKLAKPQVFRSMWSAGLRQFIPFIVTVAAIVFTDLLTGIAVGSASALIAILLDHYHQPFKAFQVDPTRGYFCIHLVEDVTFLHKAGIREALSRIPAGATVEINGSSTSQLDPDVLDILEDFRIAAAAKGITVDIRLPVATDASRPLTRFKEALSGELPVTFGGRKSE
jgi:MFS superfamily sulfate permease-like transporter